MLSHDLDISFNIYFFTQHLFGGFDCFLDLSVAACKIRCFQGCLGAGSSTQGQGCLSPRSLVYVFVVAVAAGRSQILN